MAQGGAPEPAPAGAGFELGGGCVGEPTTRTGPLAATYAGAGGLAGGAGAGAASPMQWWLAACCSAPTCMAVYCNGFAECCRALLGVAVLLRVAVVCWALRCVVVPMAARCNAI